MGFACGTANADCCPWVLFPPRRLEGAVDCIVVNVVVSDLTDGAGEEKVLPSPPPTPLELTAPPRVAVVAAFEWAASDTVSGLVDTVGAIDLLPIVGAAWSSLETGIDVLLCEGELQLMLLPDGGV